MDAVGIIAEYNPLHTGHLLHLSKTRAQRPGSVVVVCMSGNWVQRGDCAVADKWSRAQRAVQAGADLVLELPTVFAMSSAPIFAQGAVELLSAAGITALSFGCETPDLPQLQALANALNDPGFDQAVQPFLAQGLSYPAARQRAAETLVGADAAQLLAFPNNNLAVEYLRRLLVNITPIPIFRQGVHDGPLKQEYPSASSLRQLLREGNITRTSPYLSAPWEGPVYDLRRIETAILCKLRQLSGEQLNLVPDAGDGLAQRLERAARQAGSLSELYSLTKTRRLTLARIRRVTLWAFLGLSGADRPAAPAYLRVLAMSRRGAEYLAQRKAACPLPILTKSADHKELLAREARLTDLFSLCAAPPLPCGEEFRHSPFVDKG